MAPLLHRAAIIMPSVCLCATEVRALYGLRLPAPEVGGARSLHATQLGATSGEAHPTGAFSTGVCVDWGLSKRPARVDCGLYYTTVQATRLWLVLSEFFFGKNA